MRYRYWPWVSATAYLAGHIGAVIARADPAGSDEDRVTQESAADFATPWVSHRADTVGGTERDILYGSALDVAPRIPLSSNRTVPEKTLWALGVVSAPVGAVGAGGEYSRSTPSLSLHTHGWIWGFGPQPDTRSRSEEQGKEREGAALSLVVFHIYSDSPGLRDTLNSLWSVESGKLPTCNTGLAVKPTLTANLQFRMQVRIYFQDGL
jgi:hypothetical protein